MPNALMRPARTCGIIDEGVSMRICISLLASACVAGAVPLYGTWFNLMPVVSISSSVVRCAAAPMPLEPNEIEPGLALARATRSFASLAARLLVAVTIKGAVTSSDTGAKLFTES